MLPDHLRGIKLEVTVDLGYNNFRLAELIDNPDRVVEQLCSAEDIWEGKKLLRVNGVPYAWGKLENNADGELFFRIDSLVESSEE